MSEETSAEPAQPSSEDLSLLDSLPYLTVNLAKAPATLLRTLFEVVQLHVQVHDQGEQVPEITGTAERINDQMNSQEKPGADAGALVGFWSVPPVRFELTLDGF